LNKRGVCMQTAVIIYVTNKDLRQITIIEETPKQFSEKKILIASEILESYPIL
jgi:hypothetical protein